MNYKLFVFIFTFELVTILYILGYKITNVDNNDISMLEAIYAEKYINKTDMKKIWGVF